MPDGREPVSIKVLSRIEEIPADAWDACAGAANPFVCHAYLSALEESGAATAETGWLAQHLAVLAGGGRISGVAPVYVKGHSYGEYVFDHGWAHACERAGGRYYPKLQVSIPFAPVTGPRLMVRPGAPGRETRAALIAGAVELARRAGVSSLHVTFAERHECEQMVEAGFLARLGMQFHWRNRGYGTFDDFLGELNSRKRKAIRKERREAQSSGAVIRALTGDDIKAHHWDVFYRFYVDTVDRKWAHAYLNREFFDRLSSALSKRIVLFLAEDDGRAVAGALNLLGADTLYGRNWGGVRAYRYLHFEACYYRAIEFAIDNRLACVEAGAQGPHKIQRGYLPVETMSAHWIRDSGFRGALADYLEHERREVREDIAELMARSPFRKDEGSVEA